MAQSTNNNTLLWLLVALCATGIALFWLPGFINTFSEFSGEISSSGKASQNEFLNHWKDVQAEFEKGMDERKKTNQEQAPQQAIQPLGEQQLAQIGKDIEVFAKNAEMRTESLTQKSACTRQSGIYEDREGAKGSRYGICRFTDGSECHALLFMREKCHIGQYKKAEDGIPQWPDLEVTVASMEYCRRINGALATVSKDQARGVCINGLQVQNIGVAASKQAVLNVDEKKITVRSLRPQEIFTPSSPIIIQKTPELSSINITLATTFLEIDKENNTYQYAAKNQ